jgi:nitroimidazol reductase NimA-like FMN-containing flavoprotein (pyridoxamine 5'-phosphate oxidase superfamily)
MPTFSKRQRDQFLKRPLIARIATLLDNGSPTIAPIWFEWNPESRTFLLWARKGYGGLNSGWYDNLRRDPRISLLIDDSSEKPPRHDRVLAIGRGKVLPTPKNAFDLQARMTRRYLGKKRTKGYSATMPRSPGGWVRLIPDRIITWTEATGTNLWHPRYLKPKGKPLFAQAPRRGRTRRG